MCVFRQNDICVLASYLADIPNAAITEQACNVCLLNEKPMSINIVTISIAVKHRREQNKPYLNLVENLLNYDEGPGTELKKKLSWFWSPKKKCNCLTRIQKMNKWGPDECEKRMATILRWMKHSARIHKTIYIEPIVKMIVQKAINKSRLQSQQHQELNVPSIIAWHQSKLVDGNQ